MFNRSCAAAPPREKHGQGRSSTEAPLEQCNSSKHVASMFLGCSLLVLRIPALLTLRPTPTPLSPQRGHNLQTPEPLSRLQPFSTCRRVQGKILRSLCLPGVQETHAPALQYASCYSQSGVLQRLVGSGASDVWSWICLFKLDGWLSGGCSVR